MPNERMNLSGGNGESQGDAERAKIEQEIGRKVIESAIKSGDYSQMSTDDLRKIFPIRQGETDLQHTARVELIRNGKIPAPQVMEIGGGNYQELPVDRYGNGISDESFAKLMKLSPEERQAELAKVNDGFRLALEQSKNEGREQAQQELAEALAGKAPAERLEEMQPNLAALKAEVAHLREVVYLDDELKDWHQKQIAEAQRVLDDYQRKFELVAGLVPGGVKTEEPAEPETEPKGEVDTRAAMDFNAPSGNARRAYLDGLKDMMTDEEYRTILDRISQQEKKKEQDESDFAAGEQGNPTDDEIEKAAKAAGESSRPEVAKMWTVDGYRETTAADDEANRRKYARAVIELRREAERRGAGRFDDPEAEAAERRAELLRQAQGVRQRSTFKRLKMRALIGLATAAAILPLWGGVAQAGNRATTIPVQPQGVETISETVDDGEEAINEALKQAVDQATVVTDNGEMNVSAEEAWRNEMWSVGNDLYESSRFMEDENSQMMENGLQANYAEYNSPDKHSKNSYGTNKENLYHSRESVKAMIEMVQAQPQAMASFMATYPTMLKQCGVSEDIVGIKNVEDRANAVMNLLLEEKGGELQKIFLGAISTALNDEKTEYMFYQEYGEERTFYMKRLDESQPARPDNVVLKTDVKQRNGEKQVQITIVYPDGTVEVGDFNMACGFQTNLDKITYEVRTQITKKVDLVIKENAEGEVADVVAEVASETPEETTGTDSDPEPEPEPEPTPPKPTPENPKPKDEEKEKEVVDEGGQTNPVDPTEQDQPVTEEPSYDDNAQQETESGAVADETASAEEQQENHEAQEEANEDEQFGNISDDDLADYVESILNGG